MDVQIRTATQSDMQAVKDLIVSAFGKFEGSKVAALVANLLVDPSAHPLLSLVATSNGKIVGYILFTGAKVEPSDQKNSSAILAPIAVFPEFQSQGIGGQLIMHGLNQLAVTGIDLVFVLGYPGYYTKYGFTPAGVLGFEAPYPIPVEHADAWMVQASHSGQIEKIGGKVVCADSLNKPEYWRE